MLAPREVWAIRRGVLAGRRLGIVRIIVMAVVVAVLLLLLLMLLRLLLVVVVLLLLPTAQRILFRRGFGPEGSADDTPRVWANRRRHGNWPRIHEFPPEKKVRPPK